MASPPLLVSSLCVRTPSPDRLSIWLSRRYSLVVICHHYRSIPLLDIQMQPWWHVKMLSTWVPHPSVPHLSVSTVYERTPSSDCPSILLSPGRSLVVSCHHYRSISPMDIQMQPWWHVNVVNLGPPPLLSPSLVVSTVYERTPSSDRPSILFGLRLLLYKHALVVFCHYCCSISLLDIQMQPWGHVDVINLGTQSILSPSTSCSPRPS